MNEIIPFLERKVNRIIRFVYRDSKVFSLLKYGITLSTITMMILVYFLRKNNKVALGVFNNMGYLSLIKQDINKYELIMNNTKLNNDFLKQYVSKFQSLPSGITNFGNNCYINVLLHVLIYLFINLVFSK